MTDLAALVAEVKGALQQASAWGGPRSNLALVTHWPEWLGALVQAVEDQQRRIDELERGNQ